MATATDEKTPMPEEKQKSRPVTVDDLKKVISDTTLLVVSTISSIGLAVGGLIIAFSVLTDIWPDSLDYVIVAIGVTMFCATSFTILIGSLGYSCAKELERPPEDPPVP